MMAAAAATAVRVVLVEDDPDASDAMVRVLRKAGFEVESCGSAGAALVELEMGQKPAAAIIDLGLPDATGDLVLWRIRRDYAKDVPVAVISGRPDLLARPELQRELPDAIFAKPLDLRAVVAWLRRVVPLASA
jgi:DNA-binding response OmpR family regulator